MDASRSPAILRCPSWLRKTERDKPDSFTKPWCLSLHQTLVSISSPNPGVYLTIETFRQSLPLVADDTYVYVHFRSGKKEKKLEVLYGEDMQIRAAWQNAGEVTLCYNEGLISKYKNRVTLFADGQSIDLQIHLQEKC